MGAGASALDESQERRIQQQEEEAAMARESEAGGGRMRYFCHECRRSFLPSLDPEAEAAGEEASPPTHCTFCHSSFLEEVDPRLLTASGAGVRRRQYDLSEEQTRRLTSAAALLQMLETQVLVCTILDWTDQFYCQFLSCAVAMYCHVMS